MPLNEFWYEDPDLIWAYRTCFLEKQEYELKRQEELINFQAWLMGYYMTYSIGACFGKGIKYPSRPIGNDKTEKNKNDKEEIARRIKEKLQKSKKILEKGEKQGQQKRMS